MEKQSIQNFIKEGRENILYQARLMAKNKVNEDFNIEHPDWVRDAQNKNYSVMERKLNEQIDKKLAQREARKLKLTPKRQQL